MYCSIFVSELLTCLWKTTVLTIGLFNIFSKHKNGEQATEIIILIRLVTAYTSLIYVTIMGSILILTTNIIIGNLHIRNKSGIVGLLF